MDLAARPLARDTSSKTEPARRTCRAIPSPPSKRAFSRSIQSVPFPMYRFYQPTDSLARPGSSAPIRLPMPVAAFTTDCQVDANGHLINDQYVGTVGGTSAAAPAFAGMLAMISQSQGGARLGQADAVLYNLAQDYNPNPSSPGKYQAGLS